MFQKKFINLKWKIEFYGLKMFMLIITNQFPNVST